jgi:epsilon-lactone hydrolase
MQLVRLKVKFAGKPTADPDKLRRDYSRREYPVAAPMTRGVRRHCNVEEVIIQGRVVHTLRPKQQSSAWHVIYTHGGGFVNALIKPHWDIVQALVAATGATVTVPLYPLAPEHEYGEAFAFLEEVYRTVLAHVPSRNLILCGDSAGGNLAIAQTLHYRDRKLPLPAHVILFSPLADASASNPDMALLERVDVMLRLSAVQQWGKWWAGATDMRAPLLSPLYGDLRGLPPIQIYIGTDDILLPDARRLRDRVLSAGGQITFRETPGAIHVFVGAPFTPEAQTVFREIRKTLNPIGYQ